jgi:lipopolysaccharide transport system permease protein
VNNRSAMLFIKEKVRANLKADVASNYLGMMWWFLEPAMFVGVFYVVFGFLFNRGGEGFLQFLIVGIVSWLWIAGTVNKSVMSIIGARVLMAQVYLPKYCMPAVVVVESIIKQFAVCIVLLAFLSLTTGAHVSWIWMPFVFVVQLLLIAAVSFWVAALVPFVPDIRFMVSAGLQMLMFCSGIFFRAINVPEKYQFIMIYNPVANLVIQYRTILVEGAAPDVWSLLIIAMGSLLLLIGALVFLKKFDLHYPRLIN